MCQHFDHTDHDTEQREYWEARAQSEYPDHADKAREVINTYLKRYDRQRYYVFNNQAADCNSALGELGTAHLIIAEMIKYHEEVKPVPEYIFDTQCRAHLFLPFGVIDGGKTD